MRVLFAADFPEDKTALVYEYADGVYTALNALVGKPLSYPVPIVCMTDKEIEEGQQPDVDHPDGAGHGLFLVYNDGSVEIAINPYLCAEGVLLNFIHENMHFACPHWPEDDVDWLSKRFCEDLLGVSNINDAGEYELFDLDVTMNPARRKCRKSMQVQTIMFHKDYWTLREAKTWIRSHDYKLTFGNRKKPRETANYYRFRQHDTSKYVKGSFRTIKFGVATGIKAIAGKPK